MKFRRQKTGRFQFSNDSSHLNLSGKTGIKSNPIPKGFQGWVASPCLFVRFKLYIYLQK